MIRVVLLGAAVLVNPADDMRNAAVPGMAQLGPRHLSKAPQGLTLLRAESRPGQHPAAPATLPTYRLCCSILAVYQALLHDMSSYARARPPKQVHRLLCRGKMALGKDIT